MRLEERGIEITKLPIVAAGRPAILPLSYAQRRLWLIDRWRPGTALYNLSSVLVLRGELDVATLTRAIGAVVERHDVLRTTFDEVDGEPAQVIAAGASIDVPRIDLSGLPAEERLSRARALADEAAAVPFDLQRGPLFRTKLLCLSPGEHWLVVTMHHIVSDEWSNGVLASELAHAYRAFVRGKDAELPELSIQYADYALWQRRWLEGAVLGKQLDYWKKQLGTDEYALLLPTDFPRPAIPSHRGANITFDVGSALTGRLFSFSKQRGATVFMTVLAAFHVLLHRTSGQSDIRVGVPTANRNRSETEGLVGFFVNTQVLRSTVVGSSCFDDYLASIRSMVAEAQSNQDVPFEQLVEALQPQRRLSHDPLFQVMLSWHREVAGHLQIDHNLELMHEPSVESLAKFDLTLHMTETPRGLVGQFIYRTDLFKEQTIQRMIQRLKVLLADVVEKPTRPIGVLRWMDAAEQEQAVGRWSAGPFAGEEKGVHELIGRAAALRPGAVALRVEGRALSYGELERSANRLGNWLRARGIGREARVGVCLPRGASLIVGLYGVLKSGAAYVPMEPTLPEARLREMVEDSGARVVLGEESVRRALAGRDVEVVSPDAAEVALGPEEALSAEVSPDEAAYVIYTSGSTGRPKGVVVTHRGVASYVQALLERLSLPEEASMAMVSTVGADLGNTVLFGALCSGRPLHLLSEERVFDPDAMAAYMHEHGVDVLKIVPSHLKGLMHAARPERVLPRHTLVLGGEATPWELVEKIQQSGGCRIVNHYGPTETTVGVLTHEHRAERAAESVTLPLGRPLANSQVYVLSGDMQPVPVGVIGEIYIGGAGLARGYLNRAELTAERFVPNPYGSRGERLYRTGDRARTLEDGSIEFLGRADNQVKVRGYRVELGEVRAALLSASSAVADAHVLVREGQAGNARLVAYVIGKDGYRDSDALRAALEARLPEHMVPAEYVWLESFPLTANGKLDQRALPAPGHVETQVVLPRNELEEKLVQIWRELLKVERVGIHDSFFKLGGDSLLGFQMIALARKSGVMLDIQDLFDRHSIAELSASLDTDEAGDGGRGGGDIEAVARGGRLPTSFGQRRLWFLWQLSPESAAYNVPIAVKLLGDLEIEALQSAFTALVSRHETLRTRFEQEEGQVYQVVLDAHAVEIPLLDLSGLSGVERETRARALAEEEARRPFDLQRGWPVRVALLKLSAEEHVLLVTMHHIVSDGWSMNILVEELVKLYGAHREAKAVELPSLPIQYADYAVWQQRWLESAEFERQLQYWKDHLGPEHTVLELAAAHPRPAVQSYRGATLHVELGAELLDRLRALAREKSATLFMVLLAAFKVLLHRYSGQELIRVGVPHANRSHPQVEPLIGFFVNTHVLCTRVNGRTTFEDLLFQVRDAVRGAQANQSLPFEQLVEALNPPRSLSHNPLFQVLYNHIKREHQALEQMPELTVKKLEQEPEATQFDLSIETEEQERSLRASVTYSKDLFERGGIERLVSHWRNLLDAVLSNPGARIGELTLLGESERSEALVTWNRTQHSYPRERCLHELIEEQVARTPEAVAVSYGGRALSYAALNARANQLARKLRELGVGADSLVGIHVERSLEMMVGLLGILKAGGGYVPLDPEYPAERLSTMVEDAEPKVLLTQERLLARAPSARAAVWCLDRDWGEVEGYDTQNLPSITAPQNLVYCIYTSGSTGKPKGVTICHRSLVNFLSTMKERPGVGPEDRVLGLTSLSFDIAGLELYLPLVVGARVVLVERAAASDAEALIERVASEGITIVQATPATWRMLTRSRAFGAMPRCKVLCGGEALPEDLARELLQRFEEVWNLYGPTETTVWSSRHALGANSAEPLLGRPIGNTAIYVLDEALNPVPIGVAGDLYIGGDGLARGYHRRPELTAERFVPSPFGGASGERLYRTGDLARYRAGGDIEYLGRSDHQVKVRGHRIELGEIEASLLREQRVREAVVVAREDVPGERRLVAYVVPAQAGLTSAGSEETGRFRDELRAGLKAVLPEYMVPAVYVLLDGLPLTANGKVNRKALPVPERSHVQTGYVAPRNEIERKLAEIWSDVLGVERVGVHDRFFDLGGHSLLLTRMASRIRGDLAVDLSLRTLFEAGSVEELARVVSRDASRSVTDIDVAAMFKKLDELGTSE
ncbi:amino acid adenylation domain-containing protein [Sorangium sp. So ce204]|uniref:amino acid adenylation domain-containing protein n=1 Tax=Sorangium sp. So ce204 TaxID=3133288 RepID=UPI003F63583A